MEEEQEIAGRDDHHPAQQQQRLVLSLGVFAKRCAVARRFHTSLATSLAKPIPREPRDGRRRNRRFSPPWRRGVTTSAPQRRVFDEHRESRHANFFLEG